MQAQAKQTEAAAQTQQAANLRQQAEAKTAQAAQREAAAQAQRELAQQAAAQAAEYRRLAQEEDGERTQKETLFVYDEQGRLIGEYDAAGQPRQETLYLGELPIATRQGGVLYAIHTDHLGTPRVITDHQGQAVWRWDAEPFGSTPADEDPDKDGTS